MNHSSSSVFNKKPTFNKFNTNAIFNKYTSVKDILFKNYLSKVKNLKNLTAIFVFTLISFSLISQTVLFVQNWDVNVSAQINAENAKNSSSTLASVDTQEISKIQKIDFKFNNRQIAYFDDSTSENFNLKQDVLGDYKNALKAKINQQQESKRIAEEKAKAESEKLRIEEEAKAKRVAEAKINAENAAKAKQVAQAPVANTTSTPAVAPTGDKYDWMRAAGIAESDFTYVNYILSKESGWNHLIWNTGGSGAYGLCQSLPASKMASAGSDYMSNPITQLKWCNGYAQSRYGGWAQAYAFWTNNHWW